MDGATPLMYACQQGHERECREILDKKPTAARERDRTKKTALHYCAEQINTACADALLRAAPDVINGADEDGYTALHLAVIAGNKPLIQLLLNSHADINALDCEKHSVVHWATVCGEEEALEMVLRAGAMLSCPDIHGGFPLHYAAQMCGQGDHRIGLAVLRALLSYNANVDERDNDGRQAILWAASAGSADAILALVKAGAKVEAADKDGLTALHCAASRGHTDCLETLIALSGAHVDTIDINGCTALFYAVTLGHADATQLLLNLGAEPNRQDRKGRTPAHCGAAKGQLETLRILLSGGSNLWLRNVKGDVPLHEAVASGRCELVTWLLNTRPEAVNVANNDGKCPIHVAAINNNLDIIKVLLDAGSLVNPVLRSNKGEMLTPLDVALVRGHRSTAKYLQMHGGVPRSKLTDASACLRGTMLSRENTRAILPARLGLSSLDAYPMQLSVQAVKSTNERFLSGDCEQTHHHQGNSSGSSGKKKFCKRRGERKKEKDESSSEDSDVSSSCSRQHRKSGTRRRQRADKRKAKTEDGNKCLIIKKTDGEATESEHIVEEEHRNQTNAAATIEVKEETKLNSKEEEDITADLANVAPVENADSETAFEAINLPETRELEIAKAQLSVEPQEVADILASDQTYSSQTVLFNNPDSSLDETSPPLPKIVQVEAEVHQVNAEGEIPPENCPRDAQSEEIGSYSSPQAPPPIGTDSFIVVHSPPAEPQNQEEEEEEVGKLDNTASITKDTSPPRNSSTDSSSQADEELALSRPGTARRRSVVQASDAFNVVDETEPESVRDELAFYTLPDELSSERRSADGSEGLLGEDNAVSLPFPQIRRQSLVFDTSVKLPASVSSRRKSDGQMTNSTRRGSLMPNFQNYENDIFARDTDVNSIVKNVPITDCQPRSSSVRDDSGTSVRNDIDDSSGLPDSGIAPSPRRRRRSSNNVRRLCQMGAASHSPTPVSVTRAVQSTIRKYHLERKIFYQLLELKRMQIRAGCANEQVLVKRLVDDYQKTGKAAGLVLYNGNLSFRQFERFLYDQLHRLQAGSRKSSIAKVNPSDDLQSLSAYLQRSRVELGQLAGDEPLLCTHLTHRCRHAAHAYTGIPCAAYITKFNHHTMPKERKCFLPSIFTNERNSSGKPMMSERPVTVEVINGKNKQVISLPTSNLDRNKRYLVTFTIKGEEASPRSRSPSIATDHPVDCHAKTV